MYGCVALLQAFLNGELQIAADEAFVNAVQSYFEEFLKSDRVVVLVCSGGSSANDFREVTLPHPTHCVITNIPVYPRTFRAGEFSVY